MARAVVAHRLQAAPDPPSVRRVVAVSFEHVAHLRRYLAELVGGRADDFARNHRRRALAEQAGPNLLTEIGDATVLESTSPATFDPHSLEWAEALASGFAQTRVRLMAAASASSLSA